MIRIGIFFGGPSREREISFAGGKTAFEHLDQTLFTALPIFVDSFGRFIRLRPEHMYATSIREFYPFESSAPGAYSLYAESFPELKNQPVPAAIGEIVAPWQLHELMEVALLAMHGPDCEDGTIQGLLEWYRVPYTGPGIMGSSIGIDKILQNKMIALLNGQQKPTQSILFSDWEQKAARSATYQKIKAQLGLPIVVKAPHQGSSIGVAIVKEDDFAAFEAAVDQCFFVRTLAADEWQQMTAPDRRDWLQRLANLDEGIGFPVYLNNTPVHHPDALEAMLDSIFTNGETAVMLISNHAENEVLFETFIEGQEFSCGCIQHNSDPMVALPPTEVIKAEEVFDFNSKYRPGATRKQTPVHTTVANNLNIQEAVRQAAAGLGMGVCTRIDGFLTSEGAILLHDPNTIPGMSATSFIFKQMAEIGLNVTQALTYFIRQSVYERMKTGKNTVALRQLLEQLDAGITTRTARRLPAKAVVIGPTEEEYAKARKWYGRKSAEGVCQPTVYLKTPGGQFARLSLPMLFKDQVGDVLHLLESGTHPVVDQTRQQARDITLKYAGDVDFDVIHLTSDDSFAADADTAFLHG